MGRAIVREPQVFCMDEPLSNLDAKLRVQTRSQIAELQRRLGITTVYVTHDQVEAMTMGAPGGGAEPGASCSSSPPRASCTTTRPTQFVAGFIGSPAMNLRTVQLTDGGVQLAGKVLPLPATVRTAAGAAGLTELVIGMRPEHLHVTDGPGELTGWELTGSGELTGEVILVEELGADALLHVRLPEGGTPVVARTEGRKPPAPGREVTLHVQPDEVFAFHPVTGARLAGHA